ncbi:MAG: hypothetical protein Q7S39_03915 [Ignavibacteria bacterium]|nr:hypothetical protein [Ignavibacteria bacterium]
MENEFTVLYNSFMQKRADEEKKIISENLDLINSIKRHCSSLDLNLTEENFKYIETIGLVACYPNITQILFPNISIDKEGLTDFNILLQQFKKRPPKEGNLYSENFVILIHPYFRRGFHENSNFEPRFVEVFWSDRQLKVKKYIALDKNRIRIDVNGPTYFEKDTWYGAEFNKDIDKIEDGVVHLRPTLGLKESYITIFFNDVYSLDIKWETKNRIKTFQSEEFKTERIKIEKDGEFYYPARYVHAEYDLDKKFFRHFDGAVHLYTYKEYINRRVSDFNYNSKKGYKIKSHSEKLFKFNGEIETKVFINYISHFMSGNPLVHEYFEGKYPDHISEILEVILNKAK